MVVVVCFCVWGYPALDRLLGQPGFALPSIAEWCLQQPVHDGSSWVWHFLLHILPICISPTVGSSDL